MQAQPSDTSIILAGLSAFTVLIAWIFRYKIAELARNKSKAPQEILFEGYEKLLKNYQSAVLERDNKILELESNFDKIQNDLNKARYTIQEMKDEDAKKTRLINELELKLRELKTIHQHEKGLS